MTGPNLSIAQIVYDSKDRAEAIRLLTESGQLRGGKLYVTPQQYNEIWRRESKTPLPLAAPASGTIPADSIEVIVVSDPMEETKDERDARIHFERQQQVYLTYYQTARGGLFSIDVCPNPRLAAENAALYELDGYRTRIMKVTVENGEPVARWMPIAARTSASDVGLPDPHLWQPGTRISIGGAQWECVHEGKHAFWEQCNRDAT